MNPRGNNGNGQWQHSKGIVFEVSVELFGFDTNLGCLAQYV